MAACRFYCVLCFLVTLCAHVCRGTDHTANPDVIYRWQVLDYEWPDPETRTEFIANYSYIQDNVRLGNVREYNGSIYVTVPRLRKGVPSTLNIIVKQNSSDSPLLRPFPSWEAHSGTTCDHFRFVNAFEIDPNTGWMWIVDTGYYPDDSVRPEGEIKCPTKLVIFDINNNLVVHKHEFPGVVVGYGKFFLSEIVLDFTENKVTHAYITDKYDWKLVVYDHGMNYSYSFTHPSMDPEPGFVNISIANKTETIKQFGINGIAISADFKFVFYSSVAGLRMSRVPTSVLRDFKHDSVFFAFNTKRFGNKLSLGEGMYSTQDNNVFYSAPRAMYKWSLSDIPNANLPLPSNVTYLAQSDVVRDGLLEWVSSPTIDVNKNLWFTSRALGFNSQNTTSKWNYFVMRINIGEKGYMDFSADSKGLVQGTVIYLPSIVLICVCCVFGLFMTH